jgi:hypothetical protein
MYAKNTVAGQWRAHGRYLARESAIREGDPRAVGFDAGGESFREETGQPESLSEIETSQST